MGKSEKCPFPHLKMVEFVGFCGHPADFELPMYFIGNAVTLEKIIINPRNPHSVERSEFIVTEGMEAARERAKELETRLPPGVELLLRAFCERLLVMSICFVFALPDFFLMEKDREQEMRPLI
ncbi:unnamed protein product [Ilex paraguariensis]|uniref:FBD domain-containing protein n=1 Tax=Ilex paraguariensis TaxID=185542 RepID=A0ABC8THD7_9AQUA